MSNRTTPRRVLSRTTRLHPTPPNAWGCESCAQPIGVWTSCQRQECRDDVEPFAPWHCPACCTSTACDVVIGGRAA